MQYRFQDPNIGKPMGLFPKIWENNGAIFPQVGKYCNMLFPILENERDKKSPRCTLEKDLIKSRFVILMTIKLGGKEYNNLVLALQCKG